MNKKLLVKVPLTKQVNLTKIFFKLKTEYKAMKRRVILINYSQRAPVGGME